jgi:hypothetical protein
MNREEKRCETATVPGIPPAPTPASLPLRNSDDIRLEMAKVYREMRGGHLALNVGAKLVWVLSQIIRVIETTNIELQVDAIARILRARQ